MSYPETNVVLSDINDERISQELKWGQQNHPDGTGQATDIVRRDRAIIECDEAHRSGAGTWRHILNEEFHEALAERDPIKLRYELVQTAAVAVAWIEAIDRRLG